MYRKKIETLVVGAGPVGLLTALALSRRGVRVQIVDREWRRGAWSYALALPPSSLEILSELGIAKGVVEHGYRIDRVVFHEGEQRKAVADFTRLSSPWPFLLAMPQNAFEGALESALADRGISVDWNHGVSEIVSSPAGALARVERRQKVSSGYAAAGTDWVIDRILELEAGFVVGADGNRSTVRRNVGIPFEPAGPTEFFAVFEFDTDFDAAHEAHVVLTPDETASVLWPLPNGRARVSFGLGADAEQVAERTKSRLPVQLAGEGYPQLPAPELLRLLDERMPFFTEGVKEIRWAIVVRFERRLAAKFGEGHTWLAGDAAHLASPIGVASMNEGIAEGFELARRIDEVLHGGLPESRLEEFGTERTAYWRSLLGPGAGFSAGPDADEFARAHGDRLGVLIPACGEHRAALAAQLGLVSRE